MDVKTGGQDTLFIKFFIDPRIYAISKIRAKLIALYASYLI